MRAVLAWQSASRAIARCQGTIVRRHCLLVVACLIAAPVVAAPEAPWLPRGDLAKVLVVRDCSETAGDAMATRLEPPTIYLCPAVMKLARRQQPGIEPFFLAHEYGHVALQTADEAAADCWAAHELARTGGGRRAIAAAVALFGRRGDQDDSARYGSGIARADRIAACAEQSAG